MANTWISRAATGSVTSSTTFTFSFWIKRATLSSTQYFFIHENASGHTQKLELLFQTDNTIRMGWYDGSSEYNYDTEMLFRDTSAWYNFVFRYDTTQSTDSNRVRMYVNGEQISYLNANGSSPTYMTQNKAMNLGQKVMVHGRYQSSNPGNYLTGSLSHIHYCDGQSYAPTSFGETDSTTGEWKIKANPSLTYGNNGYFILKDGNRVVNDAGNSSGNFSVSGGTLTKTEDSPSNVFVTLNKLQKPYASQSNTLNFGNTQYADNNSNWQRNYGTIGATTGKYFYEFKCLNDDGNSGRCRIGWDSIDDINASNDNYYSGLTLDRAGILRGGEKGYDGYSPNNVQMSAAHSGGNFSFTANDILGMAIDIDNNTFSVYKNGNLEINAYSYASASNCSLLKSKGHFIAPSVNWYSTSGDVNSGAFNFGNGYFGTTAVSSAGTNASNNGIFEYDVPTGYTALSTKGLNT